MKIKNKLKLKRVVNQQLKMCNNNPYFYCTLYLNPQRQKVDKDKIRNFIIKLASNYDGFNRCIKKYGQVDVLFDNCSKFRVVNVSEYQRCLRNHMAIIDNTISMYDCDSLILSKMINYYKHEIRLPKNKEIYVDLS